MAVLDFLGFMTMALFLFLVFDLFLMRMATGYFPFNKKALSVYGPYTLVRMIIVALMYWLLAEIPDLFGIGPIPAEWIPYWPGIAGVTAPFLYLPLFSFLGGRIAAGNNLGRIFVEKLDEVQIEIQETGDFVVASKIIKRFKKKSATMMGDIIGCLCGEVANKGSTKIAACINGLQESREETEKLADGVGMSVDSKNLLIVNAFRAWISKQTDLDDATALDILRLCG